MEQKPFSLEEFKKYSYETKSTAQAREILEWIIKEGGVLVAKNDVRSLLRSAWRYIELASDGVRFSSYTRPEFEVRSYAWWREQVYGKSTAEPYPLFTVEDFKTTWVKCETKAQAREVLQWGLANGIDRLFAGRHIAIELEDFSEFTDCVGDAENDFGIWGGTGKTGSKTSEIPYSEWKRRIGDLAMDLATAESPKETLYTLAEPTTYPTATKVFMKKEQMEYYKWFEEV